MDIQLEKKKGIRRKHIPYLIGGVFILIIASWRIFGDHSKSVRADSRTLTISEAIAGEFNDYVRVNGQVQPISVVQLSSLEGGIVERIVAEEGARVGKGDVIVVLNNPSLHLSILDSEAQLAEKQNFLRNTLVTMEQEKLSLRQERLQLDIDVERKERCYCRNEELSKKDTSPGKTTSSRKRIGNWPTAAAPSSSNVRDRTRSTEPFRSFRWRKASIICAAI